MGKTFPMPAGMRGDAVFSTGNPPPFRHVLRRWWPDRKKQKKLLIIGHNPSDAGRSQNDPTILKVCKFALAWGYSDVIMHNLMDRIADEPSALIEIVRSGEKVMSQHNSVRVCQAATSVDLIVCAWGIVNPPFKVVADGMEAALRAQGHNLYCIDTNQDGSPKHPLYCLDELRPRPWSDADVD